MMDEEFLHGLLMAETVEQAVERIRVARYSMDSVRDQLIDIADGLALERPAEAKIASYLASHLTKLVALQEWRDKPHLTNSQNELLRLVSGEPEWPRVLSMLRQHQDELSPDIMIALVSWHADLARQAVPPAYNGLAIVLAAGVLIGGDARGWAHMVYARHCEAARPDRALKHYEKSVEIMDRDGDEGQSTVALTALQSFCHRHGIWPNQVRQAEPAVDGIVALPVLETRAASLRATGRFREALEQLNRMIPLCQEIHDVEREVRILNDRGLVNEDLGSFVVAEADYRRASELARLMGNERWLSISLTNLAANALKRGQSSKAVSAYVSLMKAADSAGNPSRMVSTRNNLATALADKGDSQSALELYQDVVSRTHKGDRSARIAWAGIARACSDLGSDDEAKLAAQMLLLDWAEGGDFEALLLYLLSPGSDYNDEGDRRLADASINELIRRGDAPAAGVLAGRFAEELRTAGDPLGALEKLERVLVAFDEVRSLMPSLIWIDHVAAEIEVDLQRVPAALNRLRVALAQVEARVATVETVAEGDWLIENARSLYVTLIHTLLDIGGDAAVAEAFQLVEASKSMALTDRRGDGPAGIRRKIPTPQDAVDAVGGQTHHALLAFFEDDESICAFLVDKRQAVPRVLRFEASSALARQAASELSDLFNGDITRLPPPKFSLERVLSSPMTDFERLMSALGPLAEELDPDTVAVCVVTSIALEGLPLHAIRDRSGRRLIERVGVYYQPSVVSFIETALSPTPVDAGRIVTAGVAAIDDGRSTNNIEGDAKFFESVAVKFRSLVGTEVTPSALRSLLSDADIAHITCHGFVDRRDPLGSGLLVSDGSTRPAGNIDRVPVLDRSKFQLTARDLLGVSLNCGLLTLRACSTARGSNAQVENEVGTLLRAFQLAGCRTIVSALWNVDQNSSLALLGRFYRHYIGSHEPAWAAMALAMRAFIEEGGEHTNVYHWAPFIVSGDWRRAT